MAEEENQEHYLGWFPYGPNGDGDGEPSWEEAGITPPATVEEYWKTYHPCDCDPICKCP